MANVTELFNQAFQHHQMGNLANAEHLYRQALQADPRHGDSHHFLGVLAFQVGRYDVAVQLIRKALDLNPLAVMYYSNLALALDAQGDSQSAVASFQKALQLQPAFPEAHNGLGDLLQRLGLLDQAVAHCREAIRLRPDFADAHNNLGKALFCQGLLAEAEAHLRRALQLQPDFVQAHNNLGVIFAARGESQAAMSHYAEALRFDANYVEAHNNLGNALGQQRRFDEAVQCYKQALRIRPQFIQALCNMGAALLRQGKLDVAIECCQQALVLDPQNAEAQNNLGGALLEQGNLDDAMANFRQAIAFNPGFQEARSNLLFSMNYDARADSQAVYEEHCRWGQQQAHLAPTKTFANNPDAGRRLRIGYVSPDFRNHALVRYIEPVLAHHDPKQVEINCYANVAHADLVTRRLQPLAHAWRSICGLTDATAAELIRRDNIDILVDLGGHTSGNRLGLFAYKPAPVQATWLGYLNTTGLGTVDYRLTDDVLDPPGQPVRDTEELMRLPGGYCCFAPLPEAPAIGALPALSRGHLTFGSLHSLFKLNAVVFDLWSSVLKAIPTARLLMFRDTLSGKAREQVLRNFSEREIPAERLDLRTGSGAPGFLGIYEEIDVSLDAFPWTGGVTTCESLWMGVPMLSLCGSRPASRNSTALLARVGLRDWALETPDVFVEKASRLPGQLQQLADLRAHLRDRMTKTICDAKRFTQGLEEAYRTMWGRWCKRQVKSKK